MKSYLILYTDLFSGRGGIACFNRYFLKAALEVSENIKFKVVILNEPNISGDLKLSFNQKASFLFCGRKSRILSKIKFIFSVIINSLKSSYIICGHINFSALCLLLKLLFGIDYMMITHGVEVWQIKNIFEKRALKSASIITSVSQFTSEEIKKQIKNIEDKLFLLSDTVDEQLFTIKEKSKELIEKYNLNFNKIILTVCRFAPQEKYKGYDKVIEALPKIISEIPDIKYFLIGEGDDLLRIKKLAKELNVEDKIICCGFIPREDLPAYYNLCDIFVMPSKKEGLGIVFLEALACGRPVIAGNQDGSKEAVLFGKLGVLVNPNDVDAIAKSIIGVLKKEVSPRLLDREYLREEILKYYGFRKFSQRVKGFLKITQKKRDEI